MKHIILWIALSLSLHGVAQTDTEDIIHDIADQQGWNEEGDEHLEWLSELLQHPLNINKADYEELSALGILTPAQIQHLLQHIEKNGKLISIYELQSIEGFDLPTIHLLKHFITIPKVDHSAELQPFLQRWRTTKNQYLLLRTERTLEKQQGHADDYLGGPWKHYLRYRASQKGDYSLGFLAEKDKGESLHPTGFDFYSFHFHKYESQHRLRYLIGDYQLQLGQGFLFSGGYVANKGMESIKSVRRASSGLRPYTSSVEQGFLRGVAVEKKHQDGWKSSVFASHKRIDANLKDDGTFSFPSSGLHRTSNEMESRHQLSRFDIGWCESYARYNTSIGVNTLFTHLQGLSAHSSLYFSHLWRNFNFFGEMAAQTHGGTASTLGLLGSLTPELQLSLSYRNFSPTYSSYFGNAFSETSMQNEKGIYYGLQYRLHKQWVLSGYMDFFQHNQPRYLVDQPSSGSEYLIGLTYKMSRKVQFIYQFKHEAKERNINEHDHKMDYILPLSKQRHVFRAQIKKSDIIQWKATLMQSRYQKEVAPTFGHLIVHDVDILPMKALKLTMRFALFDVEDYENRLYTYEKDVLYGYTNHVFHRRGMRKSILLKWSLGRHFDAWLKLSRTVYEGKENQTIGSGGEQIDGNTKTDIKMQVMWGF